MPDPITSAIPGFSLRSAERSDIAAMTALMDRSIGELLKPYLTPEAVQGSFEIMGIDSQLIDDRTYFVVEDSGEIIGCGGWSRRATLYGGDHTAGRDATMLDPSHDAARVRAMYTHPNHVRRGVGRTILNACERAARSEGFRRAELVSTMAGEPLYRACGYAPMERLTSRTSTGIEIPLLRMGKPI